MKKNDKDTSRRGPLTSAAAGAVSVGAKMLKETFSELGHQAASTTLKASATFPVLRLPEGYEIEKVAEGFTYPASVAWDVQGSMYVAEAVPLSSS